MLVVWCSSKLNVDSIVEANDIGQSCCRAVSGQGGAGLDLYAVQQVRIDFFLDQGQGGYI